MHRMLLALAFLVAAKDDVITIKIAFEKMHCDDCKSTLEAQLKVTHKRAVKSVTIEDDTATVTLPEGTAPDFDGLRKSVPSDLKVTSVSLQARGVVSADSQVLFVPRETAKEYALVNVDEKPQNDVVGRLRKAMGGKNRFEIAGEVREKDKGIQIVLTGFKAADWKDK